MNPQSEKKTPAQAPGDLAQADLTSSDTLREQLLQVDLSAPNDLAALKAEANECKLGWHWPGRF